MEPKTKGFYWAKWRTPSPGTADNGEGCAGDSAEWEIVEVWENTLDSDHPEWLLVHVAGVAEGQHVLNFEWGPGPITITDMNLAKQLQRSIELNARTTTRLQTYARKVKADGCDSQVVAEDLLRICRDGDPL